MSFAQYAEFDGLGLADLVRKKDVTPAELIECAIERTERHNGKLNAIVHKAYDMARAAATKLPDGPFKGVPFLIKDLGVEVAGLPRSDGTAFNKNEKDTFDSLLTQRFKAAGVNIFGKTNTPEFGITGTTESARLGPCRNPWNTDHITGGSSGGSAGAVAAGIVPLANASDGLGSIRIPAACCGLVGLKTTRDRNPNGSEDADRAIGFSVDHVVSRTVRDSAAMLDATGFPEPASPYATPTKAGPYLDDVNKSPGKLRIAWSLETPSGRPLDDEVRDALMRTADLLKRLGHEVVEKNLGIDYRVFYRAQAVVSAANFAAGMQRWVERIGHEPGDGEIGPLARRAYEAGKKITGQQAMWGWQQLRLMNRQIMSLFETADVFLQPVMGGVAPRVDYADPLHVELKEYDRRSSASFPFTPPFNITGQPSLSLPLWQSKSNLPIAMMFTGRYADEATLFRLAGQLEKECPWRDRRPPIWN